MPLKGGGNWPGSELLQGVIICLCCLEVIVFASSGGFMTRNESGFKCWITAVYKD